MSNLSEKVLEIVRKTREISLPHYGKIESIRQKDESAHNVVTELDEKIEKYLAEKLKELDPTIEFVGEEFGGNRDAKSFWLVDPIDGTAHFIRGMPFCSTMLALIEDGQVNFSVIYDFVNDILYHAERGKGAFRNGEPIKVSERPMDNSYVAWESHIDKVGNAERFLKLREKALLFKTVSAGYEFAMVACGKLEARVCFTPHGKDYDFAPGSLLVEEAGGIVANLGKTTYDYRDLNFVAANKKVFKSLTEGPDAVFPIVE